MEKMKRVFTWMAFLFLTLLGGGIDAEEKKTRTEPRKFFRLEDVVVEGRIRKPQVPIVLSRGSVTIKKLELKESFLEKILESVQEEPF